jgi:hypothetical protein
MSNIVKLAAKLKPKQRRFVELLVEGKTQVAAYTVAGYKVEQMKPETVSRAASRCMANVQVKQYYLALNQEITTTVMNQLEYTKQDWLRTQLILLEMSIAKVDIQKTTSFLGVLEQHTIKETNLSAALRIQEQLGKMLGLFTEDKNVENEGTTFNLIAQISKEAAEITNYSPLPKDHLN